LSGSQCVSDMNTCSSGLKAGQWVDPYTTPDASAVSVAGYLTYQYPPNWTGSLALNTVLTFDPMLPNSGASGVSYDCNYLAYYINIDQKCKANPNYTPTPPDTVTCKLAHFHIYGGTYQGKASASGYRDWCTTDLANLYECLADIQGLTTEVSAVMQGNVTSPPRIVGYSGACQGQVLTLTGTCANTGGNPLVPGLTLYGLVQQIAKDSQGSNAEQQVNQDIQQDFVALAGISGSKVPQTYCDCFYQSATGGLCPWSGSGSSSGGSQAPNSDFTPAQNALTPIKPLGDLGNQLAPMLRVDPTDPLKPSLPDTASWNSPSTPKMPSGGGKGGVGGPATTASGAYGSAPNQGLGIFGTDDSKQKDSLVPVAGAVGPLGGLGDFSYESGGGSNPGGIKPVSPNTGSPVNAAGGASSLNLGGKPQDANPNGSAGSGQDLDAYLTLVGNRSLFQVVNERYYKVGGDFQSAEAFKTPGRK
jgi:hypothetical protein